VARSRKGPGASAALAGSAAPGGRLAHRLERLVVGESLDTSRLSYDFDAHHIALVATGPGAGAETKERAGALGCQRLLVETQEHFVWCWLGKRDGFEPAEVDALIGTRSRHGSVGVGEPGRGLAGWRQTHHQARAALSVAARSAGSVVRYANVALLASVLKDDLLAASLRQIYLEPLEAGRDGGEDLRETLRAYFSAGRNVSVAGESIGVTRQAVARRLRAAEERIGRPLSSCGADLEVALSLEALESTPTPRFVP
jgi:GGDEF-like domain/PucR C-terminal helix-turn-helix domain